MQLSTASQGVVTLFGRILLGVIFLLSGIGKIGGFAGVAGYMASKGLPAAQLLLVLTIIVEIGGGLSLILGWGARIGAIVLALFVLAAGLIFHQFWAADAATQANQFNHFMKNIAIMGGMLYVFTFGAGPYSVDGRGRGTT